MFKVRNIDNNELLYAERAEEKSIRKLNKDKKLKCPCCNDDVVFKCGEKMIAHFAHKATQDCPFNDYEKETYFHLKGKKIIFDWLRNKYENAYVEMEVFIPETGQIADIFVTIPEEGDRPEINMAFEFQHSQLSEETWERRSALYKEVGIIDFWILDSAKFIKNSKANGWEHARNKSKLGDLIYEEKGFTYFLDIEKEELIVDYNFTINHDYVNVRGYRHKAEYKTHVPREHGDLLSNFYFNYIPKYNVAFLNSKKLKNGIDLKVEGIKAKLKYREKSEKERLYRLKQEELLGLLKGIKGIESKAINLISSYLIGKFEQKEFMEIQNQNIVRIYKTQVKLLNHYYSDYLRSLKLKDTLEIEQKMLIELSSITDVSKMDVGSWEDKKGLFALLGNMYRNELEKVKYVYENHHETLSKMAKYNYKYVNQILSDIDYRIKSYSSNRCVLDYALNFKSYKEFKEIDVVVSQINQKFEEERQKEIENFKKL